MDTVILDKEINEFIFKDVKQFLKSEDWYRGVGAPYRRGYLFYGPPGTGKSSFVQAIASQIDYKLCVMNLSHGFNDDSLCLRMADAPANSIILLEDIDAIFVSRESTNKKKK